MIPPLIPHEWSSDVYEMTIKSIRHQIFEHLMVLLLCIATGSVLLANLVTTPNTVIMSLWGVSIVSVVLCLSLKNYSYRWAVTFFIAISFGVAAIGFVHLSQPWCLLILSLVVFISRFMVSRAETTFITVLASGLLWLLMQVFDVPFAMIAACLALTWFMFALGFMIAEALFQPLEAINQYQLYAVEQMQLARDSRAILSKRNKMLDDSTANLHHANNQLRQVRQAAEVARRLKAQFAANVSHELRTPINLIVGFAEMIVSAPAAYGSKLPAAYAQDINTIYRNGRHLQALINDILDISQIESGHMAVVKEETRIGDILHDVADMMRDQIANKGLIFDVACENALPVLWLDRVRMRQIFINLLGNALRFTDTGSIKLTAKKHDQEIYITVVDTGQGIPQADIQHVFEEFYQVNQNVAKQGGSGLGLTLTREFVAIHHGHILVESEGVVGKGSRFTIVLPTDESALLAPYEDHGTMSQPYPKDEKRSLVLIDEDPIVRQLFERHMTKHHVIAFRDVAAALPMTETAHPTAILMRNEHAEHLNPDTRRILMRNAPLITCPMPSGRRFMQALGVTDYLVKPVLFATLRESLQALRQPIVSVLIVDDDHEVVRLFGRMLQAMPDEYKIQKAYSGLEGLAVMKESRPDVVLLDLLMPDIDGITIVQHMKATSHLAQIPIVMISARGASEALTSTTYGHLTLHKPSGFQPLEIVQCIEALVEHLMPTAAGAPAATPLDQEVFE